LLRHLICWSAIALCYPAILVIIFEHFWWIHCLLQLLVIFYAKSGFDNLWFYILFVDLVIFRYFEFDFVYDPGDYLEWPTTFLWLLYPVPIHASQLLISLVPHFYSWAFSSIFFGDFVYIVYNYNGGLWYLKFLLFKQY
jgi:hypothetical protein